MKCCFTGHRYFPWSSDPESSEYRALIERLDQAIDQVLAKGVIHFICGNAVGVDTCEKPEAICGELPAGWVVLHIEQYRRKYRPPLCGRAEKLPVP